MSIAPIVRKEVADHLSSRRFLLVLTLILLTGLATCYFGALSAMQAPLREVGYTLAFLRIFTGAGSPLPSFIYFLSIFGPIVSIALGFDSINREVASGAMLRLISNPIYRDSVLSGKVIAGLLVILLITFSTIGCATGFSILLAGFGPDVEGVFRILYFSLISFLYIGFWYNVSLLFSTVFRRATTSALACLASWTFFTLFIYMVADLVASTLVPLQAYFPTPPPVVYLAYLEAKMAVLRVSPVTIYAEAASILLNPEIRTTGLVYIVSEDLPAPQPLSLDQSMVLAWPHVSALLSGLILCAVVNYIVFLRREIRPAWT